MNLRSRRNTLLRIVVGEGPPALVERAAESLSDEERVRFDDVADEAARRHRILARAVLRSVLARYLGTRAGSVPIVEDRLGKPRLRGDGPTFSVSHADDSTLIAVDPWARRIGVDVETVGRAGNLPRRALTSMELAGLETAEGAAREERFLRHWTAKEAYLKGLGWGIRIDPREVEVRLTSSEPKLTGAKAGRWRLSYLDLRPGLVGTVATLGGGRWP
jgi:4'-phosphopantetheinyl transferase